MLGVLLLAPPALASCSRGEGISDPTAVEIARLSGRCGDQPSVIAIEGPSDGLLDVTCKIGGPGFSAEFVVHAQCIDGRYGAAGPIDGTPVAGPPCSAASTESR